MNLKGLSCLLFFLEFWVLMMVEYSYQVPPLPPSPPPSVIKTLVAFRCFNINFPNLGPSFFSIVQTSRSRGQPLCSKFAKIPHVRCAARTFKVPTSSRGPPPPHPPLRHNIDSCITIFRRSTNVGAWCTVKSRACSLRFHLSPTFLDE